MVQNPLISAIIPVYNRERYLAEAIESVLKQTYSPIELIVIDDGSTDSSAEIAKRYTDGRGQYYFQENGGIGAARNQGVRLAKGDYLAFLDSDDIWMPDKIRIQIDVLFSNPKVNLVFSHILNFLSPELTASEQAFDHKAGQVFPGYSASTLLTSRKFFQRIGYFSTDLQVGEFIDWYARAQEKRMVISMVPDVLAKRRIHQTNIGITEQRSRKDYAHILKAALDRRRKTS